MKNRKILFIIIILILILLGVLATLGILYLKTDIFKSNDILFAKYLFQNNSMMEIFSIDNIEKQKQIFNENMYTSTGDLLIQVQKEGGENKRINLKTNSKYNKERLYSEVALQNGQEELTKISFINDNNVYAIKNEEIFQYYIGIRNENLKDVATKLGMTEEQIEQIPNYIPFEGINSNLLSETQINYLKDTYFKVLTDSISKEKYSKLEKTTINIQGKDISVKGYKLTLNSDDLKQIIINILTKVQNDTETLNILEIISNLQDQTNIKEKISQTINYIQDKEIEQASQMEIILYQNNNKLVRVQSKLNGEDFSNLDIVNNNKIILTIVNNIQFTLEKVNQENNTIFTQEFEWNAENSYYKISMINSFSDVINNTAQNSSQIEIINDNKSIIKINYNKIIQIANEQIEIQELKNNNTAIINNYPKEQLDIFFNQISSKTKDLLSKITSNLDLKIEQFTDLNGYIQGMTGAIITAFNTSGINPIFQNIGFDTLLLLDIQWQHTFKLLETAIQTGNEMEINMVKDYMESAVYDLSAYAYAPEIYTQDPTDIFKDSFPEGSIVTAENVIATYSATEGLIVTITGATVKLPNSTTTYSISYSRDGKILVEVLD